MAIFYQLGRINNTKKASNHLFYFQQQPHLSISVAGLYQPLLLPPHSFEAFSLPAPRRSRILVAFLLVPSAVGMVDGVLGHASGYWPESSVAKGY